MNSKLKWKTSKKKNYLADYGSSLSQIFENSYGLRLYY